MKKVFVSGCYDILHGGHVEFFTQAKALGDYLIVSVAADDILWNYKKRKSSIPIAHKVRLIEALNVVDKVIVSAGNEPGLNFKEDFLKYKPDILAVTEDDSFVEAKKELCEQVGAQYVCLPKTLSFQKVSTSSILDFIKAPSECPLRVDFAGGWLDVPRFARAGSYIVNCTISPLVSLYSWPYQTSSGLGGSAAYALLAGKNSIEAELAQDVGWQDPAVIQETGLCVWKSGERPSLDMKIDPEWLEGHIALLWTGIQRFSGAQTEKSRDYDRIVEAGICAREAVFCKSVSILRKSVEMSYSAQLQEGMPPLVGWGGSSMKYCGAGWGGYAMYLFTSELDRKDFLTHYKNSLAVEPYLFDKYR